MNEEINITPDSLKLFLALADDAGNWSGTPLIDIDSKQRGNLTQLKVVQLLTVFSYNGQVFAEFTEKGKAFALKNGIEID